MGKVSQPKKSCNSTFSWSIRVARNFQWSNDGGLSEINDPKKRKEIEKEIADIFNYLLKLVDILNMDLEKAALEKITENGEKYPIEQSKGKAVKYSEFNDDKS